MSGWIKIHRKITEWEWYSDANTMRLFIHLLIIANHKDTNWRGVLVPAGAVLTGRVKLAESLGISQQEVRTSLEHLKATNEITIKSTKKYSIISITNWINYQQDNQQINQQSTNNQPTINHIQECKNEKNEKNEDIEAAVKAYSDMAKDSGLPDIIKITPQRKTHLKARLDEFGLDGWNKALRKVKNSDFCKGSTGWKADFDFIVKQGNFVKIMEGKYDGSGNVAAYRPNSETNNRGSGEQVSNELKKLRESGAML